MSLTEAISAKCIRSFPPKAPPALLFLTMILWKESPRVWAILFRSGAIHLLSAGIIHVEPKSCLFVCNRGNTILCFDRLHSKRELGQSPMPGHFCISRIFHVASPRCFPYTITWTEESTCNAGHGIGIWSAERHWEADPTTAGRGHF